MAGAPGVTVAGAADGLGPDRSSEPDDGAGVGGCAAAGAVTGGVLGRRSGRLKSIFGRVPVGGGAAGGGAAGGVLATGVLAGADDRWV